VIIGQHGTRCMNMNMDVCSYCEPSSHTAGGLLMVLYENASASFFSWLEVGTLHMRMQEEDIQGDWYTGCWWMMARSRHMVRVTNLVRTGTAGMLGSESST
jgi:hypothetical protein